MSGFRGAWIAVLNDVVAAGRTTLRELEARQVPSSLQRVAAYTGGGLPPPLAASLLAEIERNDWFREKVVENWEGDAGSPSGLFLTRPEGWWMEVAAAVAESASGRDEAQIDELRKRLARLEERLQKATDRVGEQRKELEAEKRLARELVDSARASVEAKYQGEIAELATLRAETTDLATRLAELESEHRELQEAFAALRARFARARRFRVEDSSAAGTTRSLPSDPVKLARLLDLQTASFGRTPQSQRPHRPEAGTKPLVLDSGIRPDSADAIRWLLGLPDPVTVLVDGYNAQFYIDRSDFTSGAARRKLVGALRRLRDTGVAKHRIVAVFDSTLPGERVSRSSLGGVEIRFTEQDAIADEEIVDMAEDLDRVVVISSDREVREGSEGNGAVVLWSEALAEWLERL
jgi:predicted RNA-binding protein with PIN domain